MAKALSLLLAAVLFALSIAAAAVLVAEVYRDDAVDLLDKDWPDDAGPPQWAFERAQRYLWLASRLAPFDTRIKRAQGELHEVELGKAVTPEPKPDPERALGYYRQALALRPSWPPVWVDVALNKVAQDQIDAEFAFATQRALTLGPWEFDVQASIATGGLEVWDELPSSLQNRIEQCVARGLANSSRLMGQVARRFRLVKKDAAAPAGPAARQRVPGG